MHTAPDTHIGDTGPFDLIGDVHGCAAELEILLARLGYSVAIQGPEGFRSYTISHPAGRKPVFLGDLVDRGPRSMDVLRLVMNVLDTGLGYCVAGNHDDKFLRWMKGRAVQLTHGIELSIAQLLMQPDGFREQAESLLENLPHHLILDNGRLLVSHAGLREDLHGRTDAQTPRLCALRRRIQRARRTRFCHSPELGGRLFRSALCRARPRRQTGCAGTEPGFLH